MLKPVLIALVLFSALTAPARAHVPSAREVPSLGAPEVAQPIDPPSPSADPEITAMAVSVPDTAQATDAAPRRQDAEWWLLAALATAVLAGMRSRRVVAGALTMLLVAFALESAIHSAHHIGSEMDAERCTVASAATQLSGVLEDPITVGLSWVSTGSLRLPAPPAAPPAAVRAVPGRSPPLA